MENQIENIELINSYLNKSLSRKDVIDFENRLKTDASFNETFKAHILFLEGLKRQQLKGEIKKAKQSYVKNKWFKYLGFISGIIILIVIAVSYFNKSNIEKPNTIKSERNSSVIVLDTLLSNDTIKEIAQEDSLKTEQPEIKEPFVKIEKKIKEEISEVKIPKKLSQIFTINNKKDTTVICKEGTKLNIKANSFIDKNNNIITEKVDLKVTEYYKFSDILLANLSTQSDGEVLETGGMLNLQAFKGSELLNLKQNSSIEIIFPIKKKNMQLFSGKWNNGNINWTLQKQKISDNEVIKVTEVEEDIEVPFAVIEQVPFYPGCENPNRNKARKCTTESISKFVQKNFNTQIADDLGLVGRQRVNVIFKINKKGYVVDVKSRNNNPELRMEANRVITLLPKMQPGKQRGRAVTVPYSLPIIFQAGGVANVGDFRINSREQDSIYVKRFKGRLLGNDSTLISTPEVINYILRTSKLGWINCDRFVASGKRIKYKLKIEDAKGVVRVSMVFKSINSVIPSFRYGNEFDFRGVPENIDVVLIAVKKDNGKLFFDMVEAKTKETPDVVFNFKEVTLEQLQKQLKKLN